MIAQATTSSINELEPHTEVFDLFESAMPIASNSGNESTLSQSILIVLVQGQ